MKKNTQNSIDGFVRRRIGDMSADQPFRTVGKAHRPLDTTTTPTQTISTDSVRSPLRSDIDESLRAVDADQGDIPQKKRRLFRRKSRGVTPKSRRRKMIKRVGLALLIIVLVVGGYFGWKILIASNNIFQGNILGLFQHERLKEDAGGRTNILIFGTSGWTMDQNNGWDGGLLTDSIMVVSVDQDDHSAYTISLPRDLYVGTCTGTGKLNEIYYCSRIAGGKSEAQAAADFEKKAGEITGLDIQYFVHANWTAFKEGVDAVGGVDIKIESSDPRGIYDVATNINYKNNQVVHLNGERALALARARNSEGGYGLAAGNFDREKNQQKVLAAIQKKATSASVLANPAAINGLLDTLGNNLKTSFKTSELQALIDIAQKTKQTKSLPLVGRENNLPDLMTTGNIGGISIVQPTAGIQNYTEIQAYIKKGLQGDKTAVIDVLNGSSVAGLAQTKADELETSGYTISAVGNSPAQIKSKIEIYQLDASRTTAAKVLEEKYGVKVKTEKLSGYTPSEDAEFILIFGGQ